MAARVHLIVVGAVFLGVVDRLDAGPYPVTSHASPYRLPSPDLQGSGAPRGGLVEITDLLTNAQLELDIPLCGERLLGRGSLSRSTHTKSLDGGAVVGVAEMPPLPGSMELFLSALVGMGAWQLARQSRDIRLGPWAEWYQTGEPVQVRHMFAFDVTFVAAPLSKTLVTAKSTRGMRARIRPDRRRMCLEWAGSVVGPRAPPFGHTQHTYALRARSAPIVGSSQG